MAGFHPPKHNNIVFHYNAVLCEKDWHYRLLNLTTGGKSADLLHFNYTALSNRNK